MTYTGTPLIDSTVFWGPASEWNDKTINGSNGVLTLGPDGKVIWYNLPDREVVFSQVGITDGYEYRVNHRPGEDCQIFIDNQNYYQENNGFQALDYSNQLTRLEFWQSSVNFATKSKLSSCGNVNSSLHIGGSSIDYLESFIFNSASFISASSLITPSTNSGLVGTSNSALRSGGYNFSGNTVYNVSEGWDGSNWTSFTTLLTAREYAFTAGSKNNCITIGGDTSYSGGSVVTTSEIFNGSYWVNTSIAGIYTPSTNGRACGVVNNLVMAGSSDVFARLIFYNGFTSHLRDAALSIPRFRLGISGKGSAGIIYGGANDIGFGIQAFTQAEVYNTYTSRTANEMLSARCDFGSTGTTTSAMAVSGDNFSSFLNTTEIFSTTKFEKIKPKLNITISQDLNDNTSTDIISVNFEENTSFTFKMPFVMSLSYTYDKDDYSENTYANDGVWSTTGVMVINHAAMGSSGSPLAALAIGGLTDGDATTSFVEAFNGSNWSLSTPLPVASANTLACGQFNSTLKVSDSSSANCYKFNGSVWSATTAHPSVRYNGAISGHQNSALYFGGTISGFESNQVSSFNGLTWTLKPELINYRTYLMGFGINNSSLAAGGRSNDGSIVYSSSEKFNGDNWISDADMTLDLNKSGSAGRQNNGMVISGKNSLSDIDIKATQKYAGNYWMAKNTYLLQAALPGAVGKGNYNLGFGGKWEIFSLYWNNAYIYKETYNNYIPVGSAFKVSFF